MPFTFGPWVATVLRWLHVAGAVLWIGCLLSFAFLGTRGMRNREHSGTAFPSWSRSLFRWGAASTWLTGMLLTASVYYALDQLVRREVRLETKYGRTVDFTLATDEPVIGQATGVAISLAVIALAFVAYEGVWRALADHARIAVAACYSLFVLALYFLSHVFTGRAVFMHAGALLGSAMAMNAWMPRGPARSEVIRRSEHNLYMSVPAFLAMIATHDAAIYERADGWILIALVVAASLAAMRALYGRSATSMVAAPSS